MPPQPALTPNDLVALVGSRIAHDLISPLGAIGNGVELLGLSGVGDLPEMALISESVDNANVRIRFFRIAFGAARPGQSVAETEVRALVAPGADGRKLEIDWQPVGDPPRGAAKLAFLLLQCLETAMPWGGQVVISQDGEAWRIAAEATRLKLDPELWGHLTGVGTAVIQPAQVHFALAPLEAAAQDRSLDVTITEAAISIDF